MEAVSFPKDKSSLISTRTKDGSQDLLNSNLIPLTSPLNEKKAALKLNLDNISSKRFFKGKIQRMDSINSADIEIQIRRAWKRPWLFIDIWWIQ